MSTGRWKFRPTDLTRALKAAKAAGVPVRIEIESDKMVVYSCDIGPDREGPDRCRGEHRAPDMKPGRSALPLPRYVLRKPLRGGAHGYFFNVPVWARKA